MSKITIKEYKSMLVNCCMNCPNANISFKVPPLNRETSVNTFPIGYCTKLNEYIYNNTDFLEGCILEDIEIITPNISEE